MPADTCLPQEAWDDQLMLSVGHLLFGEDVSSIHQALFFGKDEGSVADVYATRHVGSSAWRCIKEQFSSGWQPGAAVSGHARTRLMQQLNSGLDATAIKSISTAFKSYDSCRLSLLSLVHVLVQYTSSRTLSHAILQALPAYIDRERLLAAPSTDDAAHMDHMDPSSHIAGQPTSRRGMMCCNCGTTSTSVWRVANAGLKCCNACGTYFAKHNAHRPEHLVAACKAKSAERKAAAAAATPSSSLGSAGSLQDLALYNVPTSNTQAAAAAVKPIKRIQIPEVDSDSSEQPRASKRQRKTPMRLASEDFVLQDSFTSSMCFGFETAYGSCDGSDGSDGGGTLGRQQSGEATFENAVEVLMALKHDNGPAQLSAHHSMPYHSTSAQHGKLQQPQHQQFAATAALFADFGTGINTAGLSAAPADPSAAAAADGTQASTPQADAASIVSEARRMVGVWTSVMGQSGVQADCAPAAAGQAGVQEMACELSHPAFADGSPSTAGASSDMLQHLQWYGSMGSSGSGCFERGGSVVSGSSASEDAVLLQQEDSQDSIRLWDLALPGTAGSGVRPQGQQQQAGGRGALSRFGAEYQAAHVLPASAQPGGSPRAIAASPGRNRRGGGQHKCCSNCSSQQTPAWRRDKEDHSRLLCNPCGIYKNTNGVDRPLLAGKVPSRKQASGKQLKGGHKAAFSPEELLAGSFSSAATNAAWQQAPLSALLAAAAAPASLHWDPDAAALLHLLIPGGAADAAPMPGLQQAALEGAAPCAFDAAFAGSAAAAAPGYGPTVAELSSADAAQPVLPAEQQEHTDMQRMQHQQLQQLLGTPMAAAPAATPVSAAAGVGEMLAQQQQDVVHSEQALQQHDMVYAPTDYKLHSDSRTAKPAVQELQGLSAATLQDHTVAGRSSSSMSSQDVHIVLQRTSSAANNGAEAAAPASDAPQVGLALQTVRSLVFGSQRC